MVSASSEQGNGSGSWSGWLGKNIRWEDLVGAAFELISFVAQQHVSHLHPLQAEADGDGGELVARGKRARDEI